MHLAHVSVHTALFHMHGTQLLQRHWLEEEGRHFAVNLFVHTHKTCTKGRSIFSRSTEDGPAFS